MWYNTQKVSLGDIEDMKTTQKKLDKCQVNVSVELDADEAAAIIAKVEKRFVREAEIPGFRKGKVPLEIIRRQFAKGLEAESKRMMFSEYYPRAIKEEKVEEVALADVAEMKIDKDGASFVATVDVKPEFKLPTYKGLKISSESVAITDEQVENQFESLRNAYAKYEDSKEGDAAAKGDYVQIDYKGTVKGKNILENVSFTVKPGESIALVGPTGAGKTTIVNLLSRFYDLTGGAVLIDGNDISKVTLHSLREKMGIMMQDSFIFSGTIEDNIRYGKLDATEEEIRAAAKTVCADDFIMGLEKGYKTEMTEGGTQLSGGQRQLISFARTLISDPKILILDEATSAIDARTEKLLQDGLNELLKGRTSFIIAHRLSTIKNCDKIMYVSNKGITECGTHDELMAKKGDFYKLRSLQS